MNILPDSLGDPRDDDDEPAQEGDSSSFPRNLDQEGKELRDAIKRVVDEARVHEHVDQIPSEKGDALEKLGHTFLTLDPPYGSGNGYDENGFADIDESLGWFLLKKELGVEPVREPSDHLSGSVFSVNVDTEDFGLLDDHDGYGYRITVYFGCHNEDGKFVGRRKGETDLYPTMFRAAIAALDVARDIKQDWFSHRGGE